MNTFFGEKGERNLQCENHNKEDQGCGLRGLFDFRLDLNSLENHRVQSPEPATLRERFWMIKLKLLLIFCRVRLTRASIFQ